MLQEYEMNYPEYIDRVESICLKDPLSSFLGVFAEGVVEFSYLDVVKSAGHSCPTIAGAYLSILEGLKVLYKEQTPVRGEIAVEFANASTEGVSGVIANVITQITGATQDSGFKGIKGSFSRVGLMSYEKNIHTDMRLTRLDTNATVSITYDPTPIAADERQVGLMSKLLEKKATKEEERLFQEIWHTRVEMILNNREKVLKIENS